MRGAWRSAGPLAAVVTVLAVVPLIVQDSYLRHLLILAMLFAVLASSWDLTLGIAGIFNFAHAAIFAIGAYTSAILVVNLGAPVWVGLVGATVAGPVAASLAFFPAVRLRGVYVALTTFAFGQIAFWLTISQRQITGGTQGKVGIPPLTIGDFSFSDASRLGYYYLMLGILIASTVFLRWVTASNVGRSLIAIRESEEYAASRGIPIARQQLLAFVFSAIFTGLVGGVYAHYIGAVATDLFGFGYAALLLSMVWFGGAGTIYGPILGAFVLTFASESLAPFGPWRFASIAALIIVTLAFFPDGVWGLAIRVRHRVGRLLSRNRRRTEDPTRLSGETP